MYHNHHRFNISYYQPQHQKVVATQALASLNKTLIIRQYQPHCFHKLMHKIVATLASSGLNNASAQSPYFHGLLNIIVGTLALASPNTTHSIRQYQPHYFYVLINFIDFCNTSIRQSQHYSQHQIVLALLFRWITTFNSCNTSIGRSQQCIIDRLGTSLLIFMDYYILQLEHQLVPTLQVHIMIQSQNQSHNVHEFLHQLDCCNTDIGQCQYQVIK